jgi:hypothetical protein
MKLVIVALSALVIGSIACSGVDSSVGSTDQASGRGGGSNSSSSGNSNSSSNNNSSSNGLNNFFSGGGSFQSDDDARARLNAVWEVEFHRAITEGEFQEYVGFAFDDCGLRSALFSNFAIDDRLHNESVSHGHGYPQVQRDGLGHDFRDGAHLDDVIFAADEGFDDVGHVSLGCF